MRRRVLTKTCKRCGTSYHPSHTFQTYCSPPCRWEAERLTNTERLTRPCAICGKSMRRALDKQTCSPECGRRASSAGLTEYHARRRSGRARACPECGVTFTPFASAVARGAGKYCSQTCYFAVIGRRPAMVEATCFGCGAIFRRTIAAVNRVKRTFCSNACKAKALVGELAPTYRGGNWRGGRGPGWEKIAAAVRERDGYRCRRCGKHQDDEGSALSVDHVIPWRSFTDHVKANELSNLVALCRSCHGKKARAERKWLQGDVLDMWAYQVAVAEPWDNRRTASNSTKENRAKVRDYLATVEDVHAAHVDPCGATCRLAMDGVA